MNAQPNRELVCMVRGGEASRIVQEQALSLARQEDRKIVFLHIIDLSSLELENEILVNAARTEVTWLARVNLNMAYRRARSAGVQAETAVRYGPIFKTVCRFLQERNAECLFLGAPRPGMPDYDERMQRVHLFADRVTAATGISVCIGKEGETKILSESP